MMMVAPVTVVTLTVGSILSMKTVIVGLVTEKTVAMVAVACGRRIAK